MKQLVPYLKGTQLSNSRMMDNNRRSTQSSTQVPVKKYYPGQRYKDGFAAKTATVMEDHIRRSLKTETDGSGERKVSRIKYQIR